MENTRNETTQILEDYKSGRIERRQAIRGLAVCFATAFVAGRAPAAEESAFASTGLNHLALRVTDVARSRDFYVKHFGFGVLRDNAPGNCFLECGDNFLALFRGNPAGLDHFCLTIEDYDPAVALQRLEALGLEAHRVENRVYFKDPDGLKGQLSGRFSSWPGER